MTKRVGMQCLSLILCGLLASPLFSPLSAASGTEALGRIVAAPPAAVNGVALPADTTLFSGDRITTGPQGWARVILPQGVQIHLTAQTQAQATRQGDRIEVDLVEGRLTLRTRGNSGVLVRSNGLEIVPRTQSNAVWEVARLGEGVTLVTSQLGPLEVRSANRTVEVLPGQSLRLESRLMENADQGVPGAAGGAGMSAGTKALITLLVIVGAGAAIAIPIAVNNSQAAPVSPSGP